jgi:hypothetical protein
MMPGNNKIGFFPQFFLIRQAQLTVEAKLAAPDIFF